MNTGPGRDWGQSHLGAVSLYKQGREQGPRSMKATAPSFLTGVHTKLSYE